MNIAPAELRIHKYSLVHGVNNLPLPKGAFALSCGFQGTALRLWATVDPWSRDIEERRFKVVCTGESWPADDTAWKFLATAITSDESYVVHVFEEVQRGVDW